MATEHKIHRVEEYKLYLNTQLGMYIKNEKKLKIMIEQMYLAFEDGVRFGRGNLKVNIEG